MEFNSSCDQTNFKGYYPPSPISNGGWEYHHENTNSEHSNPWKFASETQDEQENHMGYFTPPQNDASHYSNGGWDWAYQQEYEQSSEMNYFPEPQSDPHCYDTDINCGWKGNFNVSSSVHQGTSSFDCAVNAYMENCSPLPQNDSYCDEFNNSSSCAWENQNQKAFDNSYCTYQELSLLEQTFNSFMESCQTSPPSFSSENSSSLNYPWTQNPFQNSKSTQTSMNQSLSRLETMFERYEREAQRSWNDQENSFKNMEVLINQMLSVKEEVEEKKEEAPVSSKFSVKNEMVEVFEPETALEMTREHESSQPSQTFLNKKLSTLDL
ncbi:uncharacterized protein DS421_19g655620 [Arachis hypogaea]|uniref:Uncharacterized protein n=1 Tax=Arachis hypogaea TaxID=3818 RepID=A0A6B9V946_ARAHY|nr:uncharacterized protein DS421_19g655620 [Arachis hypogaea]